MINTVKLCYSRLLITVVVSWYVTRIYIMLTRGLVKVNIATDRQAHTTTVDVIKVGLTLTHTNYNTLYLCMNTKC